ncbi:hypothetical protein [Paracoccus rhizosphaerae]|uniref:Uncharacterized protein n=1 Tax=Paracoccus rhizosphaerae TaxID=1133347 RepID=A0ABV6CGA9_9RHOB|nr:hypothetical protein [Paracoccus rhizosphaerae]
MANGDEDTEEPQDDAAEAESDPSSQPKGRRRSFGKVRRELTEDELGSPGVQKLLLDELDRADGAEGELRAITEKFYDTYTKLAVANEKLKTHNAFDVISTGTAAAGSLLFGAAFSIKDNDAIFWLMLIFGGALVAVGVAAKVMRS